jgi:hypothetical protein
MNVRRPRTRLMCGQLIRAPRANITPHNVNHGTHEPERVRVDRLSSELAQRELNFYRAKRADMGVRANNA